MQKESLQPVRLSATPTYLLQTVSKEQSRRSCSIGSIRAKRSQDDGRQHTSTNYEDVYVVYLRLGGLHGDGIGGVRNFLVSR